MRFSFINLAGRVMIHSRQLIMRLNESHPACRLLLEARRRLRALWQDSEKLVSEFGSA